MSRKINLLPRISDLDKADPHCTVCKGQGWVCENHQTIAWNEGYPPCCGGAGAPCVCNPLSKRGGQVVPSEKPDKPVKTLEISPDDLMVICGCRKVTMHIKNGKKDLRSVDLVVAALREACTLACGCRVMLSNVTRKTPND